jgi:hypothetical protein
VLNVAAVPAALKNGKSFGSCWLSSAPAEPLAKAQAAPSAASRIPTGRPDLDDLDLVIVVDLPSK